MKIIKTITEDGLKFTGFLSTPEESTKRIIIHIHGMAGSPYENDWYMDFHKYYPENGYAFLAGQLRGTGEMTMFATTSGEYPVFGDAFEIFEESIYDIDAWVKYARDLGYTEIILQAHSFGPSKVLFYVNQKPSEDIKALVLISPVDMLGFALIDPNYQTMLLESKKLATSGNRKQILSELLEGDTYLSAGTFLNLFNPESKANIFCYTDRDHDWSVVNKINIPVFLIGGTQDGAMENVLAPDRSFEVLKRELKSSPRVDWKIYDGAKHLFDGFADRIVQDVSSFLKI